ncbi:hypothetical protein ACWD26_31685 [Streptomyces sp. NPDC002787]
MTRNRRADARRRRHTWWTRALGLAVAPLAAAAGVAGVVALATVPDAVDEVRAFRSARPCTLLMSPPADCLHTYPATVRGTVIENEGRSQLYLLELDGRHPVPAELDMDDEDPR